MRIERLDLVAFGNFTDAVLDLSSPGLQVVYGPNEAGKTTARAAVSNLLYDFDLRTTYAFVHPMSKLQIGARLRSEDATTLEVVRYKRNKDPLVEAGSNRPIGAPTWAGLLQGVSRADFEAMFTLGWDELVRGTAELLARGGVLGETLFAAGLGVRELGAVLERLDAEAATLFSPRPSTRTVNTALKAHGEARRRATELSVRPAHYAEVVKDHEKAAALQARLASQRRDVERDHERLVTLRGVLPTLRERAKKLDERTELLGRGPVPPAAWAMRVEQALEARAELTRDRSTAAGQLQSAEERLGVITVDEALLAVAERVDLLAEGIAGYAQGRSDRGGLDEGRRDAERDAFGILRALAGGAPGIAELEDARTVLAGKAAFAPARDEWTAREAALERARDGLQDVEDEIAGIKEALALLPEADDPEVLRVAVDAALRQGDLDGMLSSARSALGSVQSARLEMAGRLGLAEGEIADALACPSPSAEEVEEILGTLDDAATSSRVAEERARGDAGRERVLARELETLALEVELPSEADLIDSRRARDETWSLVKASWLECQAVTGEGTAYPDERALASSYEQAGEEADSVVDRLWREAGRTARRNGLTTELERVRAEHAEALEESRRLAEGASAAYAAWRSGWPPHRLPMSPAALRQWAANLERLLALHAEWTTARLAHREAFRNLRAHRGRIAELLATFGVAVTDGTDLEPVLARASAFLGDVEKNRNDRAEKERRLRTIERGLPTKRAALDDAASAEQMAAAGLIALLGAYGAGVASPRDARGVLARLDQLERLLDTRDNRLQRIGGIDQRSDAFEGELRELLARAPDIAPEPAAEAARELVRRVKTARDSAAARTTLEANRASAQATLDDADAKLTGLRDEFVLLAGEGGLDDLEKLGTTAERALRIAALDHEIDECDALLTGQGGGRSIAELEDGGLGRDLAELNAAIEESTQSRATLSAREQEATDAERDLRRQLEAMDGSDAAASEAARAQYELSRAVEAAERYTRVVLARFIADEAIRRYSEAHQDPLLGRASRYLQLLTEGGCREIGIGEDPKKGPRLSAIYSSGEERSVPQLSDGTRDQLYFALRLAAIEEALGRNGPMPVVLDDVLVNFDDNRARAALRCLAVLAASSQVLLFTHHRHILSLADEVLPPEQLTVHELAPSRVGTPG
ncbi:MAG: AAA family ATPase [Acidimicrobiales bacterium]